MLWRGPWRFVHSRGKMAPEAKLKVPFPLEGVQNPWTPVTACYNCLLYLCIIVIPLLEVLLPSSNIITADNSLFNKQTNEKQLPRTHGCFVHSAKSTNAGNDQFSCYPARREPCNMRFCCASHDWFSTNQTSQFAQRYNNTWCCLSLYPHVQMYLTCTLYPHVPFLVQLTVS